MQALMRKSSVFQHLLKRVKSLEDFKAVPKSLPPVIRTEGVYDVQMHSQLNSPKGSKPNKCIICNSPSRLYCKKCSWISYSRERQPYPVCYCNREHAMMDCFHPVVCDDIRKMKMYRPAPDTQLCDVEQKRASQLREMALIDSVSDAAMRVFNQGDFHAARQGASFVVKMSLHYLGVSHQKYRNAEMHMAYCSIKLGDYTQALTSMSKVEISLMESSDVPSLSDRAEMSKILGMIKVGQGLLAEARENFAEEIYCYTSAYGTDDWRTGCALCRLAEVFREEGRPEVCSAIYRKSTDNWVQFLNEQILQTWRRLQQEETQTFLGIIPKARVTLDLDIAVKGIESLGDIYQFRKEEPQLTEPRDRMLTSVALAMLYSSQDSAVDAQRFATVALQSSVDKRNLASHREKLDVQDVYRMAKIRR